MWWAGNSEEGSSVASWAGVGDNELSSESVVAPMEDLEVTCIPVMKAVV